MTDDPRIEAAELMESDNGIECIGAGREDWSPSECGCSRCYDGEDPDTRWLAVAAGLRASVERHEEVTVDFFADPLDLTAPTMCQNCRERWPCPDAAAQITIATAYLRGGGAE